MRIFAVIGMLLSLGTVNALTREDVIQTSAGVKNGIVHEKHIELFQSCFSDITGLVNTMEEAVERFIDGDIIGGLSVMRISSPASSTRSATALEDKRTSLKTSWTRKSSFLYSTKRAF